MQSDVNAFKVAALAAVLALASQPFAGENVEPSPRAESAEGARSTMRSEGRSGAITRERLSDIREKTVSADELMSADVYDLADPVGNVRDLVLSEDGRSVEYVIYEIPFPDAYLGASDGFVAFENVDVNVDDGMTYLRFGGEPSDHVPAPLEITRAEVDSRLLTRLLGSTVTLPEDETRQLEDVLIDRETGEIAGYVLRRDRGSWFNEEPRIIPADQVTVDEQGELTASGEFAALETID